SLRPTLFPQLPVEPQTVFQQFLESIHGRFLDQYITKNDELPQFDPPLTVSLKVTVLAYEGYPSLLLHALPGDVKEDNQPITQAKSIITAMNGAKNNMLVLLGTSGCRKTRTCYEVLCLCWGFYFTASRKGNGGSSDIESIRSFIKASLRAVMNEDDANFNHNIAEDATHCIILSRLFILHYCRSTQETFSKQRWLLLQTCQRTFGHHYNYNDDLFLQLAQKLTYCSPKSVREAILTLYEHLAKTLKFDIFPIILDEAQALEKYNYGDFRSWANFQKHRSLLSPVIDTLRTTFTSACVIPCGTGLSLLYLEDSLVSGIAKRGMGISKFTDFGEWENVSHVQNYVSKFVELTGKDYSDLYGYFRGWFCPIVTCVEELIRGTLIPAAIEKIWKELTLPSPLQGQLLYDKLSDIVVMQRPNTIDSINVFELYKSVTLAYYYSGGAFLFTNVKQMEIVEAGFGHLKRITVPTALELEQKLGTGPDDTYVMEGVDIDLSGPIPPAEPILTAYIDEPFALHAVYNFLNDGNYLEQEILSMMSKVDNDSAAGFLWELYLPKEFERIFNGSQDIAKMVMFHGISETFPAELQGRAQLVQPSDEAVPRVSVPLQAILLENILKPHQTCAQHSISQNLAVLRFSVHALTKALNTLDPKRFYKDINGNIFNEESNAPAIQKMCELSQQGSIGLVIAYPADVCKVPFVTNSSQYSLRQHGNKQVIGIIDNKNASQVFQKEHLAFLDALKDSTKSMKRKAVLMDYGEELVIAKHSKTS
ncbi:8995_t:CDS:2, partial [Paraglomus brasilianum]